MSEEGPSGNESSDEYDCPSCDRSFKNRLALGTHHGRTHGESITEYERRTDDSEEMISCPACDKQFKNRTGIGTHFARSHDSDEPLRELMAADLAEFAEALGHVPTTDDLNDSETDIWTQRTYHTRFGSLNAAFEAAGLAVNHPRNVPDDVLEEELRRVAGEVEGPVYTHHMDDLGRFCYMTYIERYETWPNACEKAGVEASDFLGQNNSNWRGGKSVYDAIKKQLGPVAWCTTARWHREDQCSKCGSDELVDLHHLVAVLSGGDNGEWNLMTLCRSCHNRADAFIRRYTELAIRDFTDEELPDGRLPSSEYLQHCASTTDPQAELTQFS